MAGLYQIHDGEEQPVGQLWLKTEERNMLRSRGALQLYYDPFPPFPLGLADIPNETTLTTYTLYLNETRAGEWIIQTDAPADLLEKAKKAQEQKMRFPVPLALFPG